MNTLKLITLPIAIIASFVVLMLIINMLLKHFRARTDEDGRLKLSYGIWFGAIFICGANVISSVIDVVIEAVDNIIKIHPINIALEITKTTSILIGVGFIWLLVWYFVVKFLTGLFVLKRNEDQEMHDDGISYFIIKGTLLLGIIFSMTSVLELILKLIVPDIKIPFYH